MLSTVENAWPRTERHATFATEPEADLLEKVTALLPLLRREAAEGERRRDMTDAVFRALDELNIWWMLLPRRWGGYGLSTTAMSRINGVIAKGDPAVAWVVQILNGATWIGSLASDELQRDLFGEGPKRIGSSFATAGDARPVAGGYVVDGIWPYNSGSRQSHWGYYLVNITREDGSVAPGNFAFVEMKDVEIVDTWFTAGLQGTSSDSARISQLFVPEHRMVRGDRPFGSYLATNAFVGEPGDYMPNIPTIRTAGLGLQLGAVEAAVELAIETANARGVPTTTYARQAQSPVVQRKLGEAMAKVRAARLILENLTRTLDAHAERREMPDLETRALNKAQCSLIVEMLNEVMNSVMYSAGSSAFLLDNPLQRYWRDVNVAARHAIYNPDVGYEIFGRVLLDVSPNIVPEKLI